MGQLALPGRDQVVTVATESPADVMESARRLGEEVFLPNASRTDAADIVPRAHLDMLGEAGFYGLAGPKEAGGLGVDAATACRVVELLAGCCLTTTFVWMQHHGAVFAVAGSSDPLREEWLRPLCRGERRAGVALTGVRPGHERLSARPVEGGWVLDGSVPWVTGWGRIDVVHTAARHGDDSVVWMLVDADECDTLRVERTTLVAVNASSTVRADFLGHFVPSERVVATQTYEEWAWRDAAGLRINGSLALGVAGRCCRLLGPTGLDAELVARRAELDGADPHTMPTARAAASELASRAASALVAASGSRGVLLDEHPQRLSREAMFLLAFGQRQAIRSALMVRLGATPGRATSRADPG
ncbi:MAG TPA: acyl-CoA dehydrogenase family protein [Acidimicrobiales bacterium]|nr:acyl-CoA dehydrogenase family protein [Acidimicrobiales bacterium]